MEEPITVEVLYEWKSARCYTCKVFGHSCKLPETKENGKKKGKKKETGEAQLSKAGCLGPIVIRGHPPASQKACHEVGTREGGKEADAEGDNKGEGEEIDAEGDNEDTQNKNPKELPYSRLKAKRVETGKLPQCEESSMDSMSGTGDNKRDNNEATGSSSSETQLTTNNMSFVLPKILPHNWEAVTNIEDHPNGCIVIGWNASKLQLRYRERTYLWNYIQEASEDNKHIPWAIMGDFNVVLRPCDRSGGTRDWQ
ncbi:hypothetical protein SADUNF_Sadunf19G0057800 [Salix dunnii]|uniref:Uncharacterized protein n=1 Tax=Salix dunnii TaxID=1413687 RepID=A0A835MF85_9ROSI|nr:hypothetical protein SADUNF_Sadunf19G0057800 [Salix dunnii]